MRVTGAAVALIGLAIMTYCAIMWGYYNFDTIGGPGETAYQKRLASNFMIPMAISLGTVTLGMSLVIFGDKGFKFSRNLAERN